MTQQTPQLPAPLAVPWTPQTAAVPARQAAPQAPMVPQHHQALPQPSFQPQPHLQHQAHSSQFEARPQFQPQTQAGQAHSFQSQPQYAHPSQGIAPPPNMQPPAQQAFQAPHPRGQPHYGQAPTHPPMPSVPHAQDPRLGTVQAAPQSKSLLKSLLNRKPKTPKVGDAPAKASGSLFDKNFVLGLAAGVLLGFLVLPMVFSGSPEPTYSPVAEAPLVEAEPATQTGEESFVDAALASDAP